MFRSRALPCVSVLEEKKMGRGVLCCSGRALGTKASFFDLYCAVTVTVTCSHRRRRCRRARPGSSHHHRHHRQRRRLRCPRHPSSPPPTRLPVYCSHHSPCVTTRASRRERWNMYVHRGLRLRQARDQVKSIPTPATAYTASAVTGPTGLGVTPKWVHLLICLAIVCTTCNSSPGASKE